MRWYCCNGDGDDVVGSVDHSGDEDDHANNDDDNLRWRKCAKVRQSPARQTKSGKSPAVRQPKHILSTVSTAITASDRNTEACIRGAVTVKYYLADRFRWGLDGGYPLPTPHPPLWRIKLTCWDEIDSMTKKGNPWQRSWKTLLVINYLWLVKESDLQEVRTAMMLFCLPLRSPEKYWFGFVWPSGMNCGNQMNVKVTLTKRRHSDFGRTWRSMGMEVRMVRSTVNK